MAKNSKAEAPKRAPSGPHSVTMKAPEGIGNVGLSVGGEVIQVEPDDDGYVEVEPRCVGPLRGLGFTTS